MRATEKGRCLPGNPQEHPLVAPLLGHVRSILHAFACAISASSFSVSESTLALKLSSSPSSSQGLLEQRSDADTSLPRRSSQYLCGVRPTPSLAMAITHNLQSLPSRLAGDQSYKAGANILKTLSPQHYNSL